MRKRVRIVLSLALFVGFVFALIVWVDWPRFVLLLGRVRWSYIAAGGLLYSGVYAARAVRMQSLLPQTTFGQMFWINSVQYFLNKMLPARTGELTLPALIQRYTHAGFGHGLAMLLLLRYMDVMVILGMLTVSLFAVPLPAVARYRAYAWMPVATLFAMLGALLLLPKLAERIPRLKRYLPERRYLPFIAAGLRDTLFAWMCLYGYLFCAVRALNLCFPFWAVVFAATFSILTIILPVSAVGNFGTFEAGWVLGFVMLGMSKGDALATGFFTNVVLTVFNGALALPGILFLERTRTE
jgi:uncharacterized membrane protein YbhN (UPF0104 family)